MYKRQLLHRNLRAARGAWSTGHGDFDARIPGDHVALISSPRGIPELERLVLEASQAADPLAALQELLASRAPRADFARSRVPSVAKAAEDAPPSQL